MAAKVAFAMTFLPNSLAFRLLAMTTLWTATALLVTGIILSTLFRQNSEREFERLLLAHAYNLMGAIDEDETGSIAGSPNLGDPRFLQPLSGWYWSVATAENAKIPILHSSSIGKDPLPIPPLAEHPFDEEFRRLSQSSDDDGNVIVQLEAQLFVGEGDTLYQVLVAGNKNDVELVVQEFNQTLALFFLFFGIGTILATYFAIKLGLRPLTVATNALNAVREGEAEKLEGDYPSEINPLADEINALIGANRNIVERARTQVGNLAHALKTPLAVIMNEMRSPNEDSPALVDEQAKLMRSQVQSYLDRARIAAQRDTTATRIDILPVVNKMVRVMEKLSPEISFQTKSVQQAVIFRGEQQDIEEVLGNLLENASRFAIGKVLVSISGPIGEDGAKKYFSIQIDDDGPGLSVDNRQKALNRGTRLDESKPGSGLGLSIVRDIAAEYGGRFELGESEFGGLSAVIFLPIVSSK